MNWRDSVLSAPMYPVDWRDSVLSAGTLWTGGTQSFRPSGILLDWKDVRRATTSGTSISPPVLLQKVLRPWSSWVSPPLSTSAAVAVAAGAGAAAAAPAVLVGEDSSIVPAADDGPPYSPAA